MLVTEVSNLENQEGRERLSPIDNQNLNMFVKQNPRQSVREMSQSMGDSISTLSDCLKKINKMKKLDKWVPDELSVNQRVWSF